LIYFLWFLAQIILLIVLLNFVIALISQYYENVMNSKVMHVYEMKQSLNQAYHEIHEFRVRFGF
jgi:ABC-type bacteriocin/lantibiotic exporter with double-glycine peptidase domain